MHHGTLGGTDNLKLALREAEAYDGPSLIIAYSHCIAHGYDMAKGLDQQKLASDSGHWLLYRYNPTLKAAGKNPLQLDSKQPKIPLQDFFYNENRYSILRKNNPAVAQELLGRAQEIVADRWQHFEWMAKES